ncbi:MAG: isoamylase early set domain-containing protein, partial [Limisphaerales bacterium]
PNAVKRAKLQNFSYFTSEATNVQLVGCFTNWQEWPINLQKRSNGVWWTTVRLERGTYYYRFLVDGQWCDDPECPLVVPNPFGCLNAVRQVN